VEIDPNGNEDWEISIPSVVHIICYCYEENMILTCEVFFKDIGKGGEVFGASDCLSNFEDFVVFDAFHGSLVLPI
jgi:hypothetical protein